MLTFSGIGLVQNVLPLMDVDISTLVKIPKIPITWTLVVFLVGFLIVVIEGGYKRSEFTQSQIDELRREVQRLTSQPTGPEMWLALDGMIIGERVLRITNVAGGTARDVQLEEMTDGKLASEKSEVIPFLEVGRWAIVKPRVTIADEDGWGDFSLDSFLTKAEKPVLATVHHLDANGALYTTVFRITPAPESLSVEIRQIERRRSSN